MKMRSICSVAAICGLVFLSGCGLKFKDEMVNLGLPDDWKYRTPVKNTADLRFFMSENVGLVVTPSATSADKYDILAQPILPDNFTTREQTIKDGGVYSSKITQGASVQGGYLTFAASLSATQATDFRIVDISRVDIPWNKFPDAKIRAFAATPNPSNAKRLWIQSLILSRVLSQSYSEIKCDASGSGPAFQAGGKCFNSTGVEVNDFAIGTVFVDVDKYVQSNPGAALSPSTVGVMSQLHSFMGPLSIKEKRQKAPQIPEYVVAMPPITEIQNIVK